MTYQSKFFSELKKQTQEEQDKKIKKASDHNFNVGFSIGFITGIITGVISILTYLTRFV